MTCFEPDLTPEQERAKGKEYYDAIREGAEVKTGLISSGIFEDTFREIIEADKDILYFSLSKNISGNYNSARVAADAVLDDCNNGRKIRLVDSLNASLGQGLLAIYASEMREKGMSFDEVADTIETYPARLNGVFTVGNLKYVQNRQIKRNHRFGRQHAKHQAYPKGQQGRIYCTVQKMSWPKSRIK